MSDACAAAPGDRALCERAGQVKARAILATRDSAAAACALADASEGALAGCVAALGPIRRLDPSDPVALELAELAGRHRAASCGEPPDDPALAIARVACGEPWAASIAAPGFDAWVGGARAHAAARLGAVPARPGSGAEAALLAASACLAPHDDLVSRRDRAVARFVEDARVPLSIEASGDAVDGTLCAAVAHGLGGRVSCGAGGIAVRAHLGIDPVAHTVDESLRTERYLAEVLRDENPAYQPNVRDERRSREEMRDAEERYRIDQAECDRATAEHAKTYCTDCPELRDKERVCAGAEVSRGLFLRREEDWRAARDRLDATPAILEREVWADASFTVQVHTWRAVWLAEIDLGAGAVAVMGQVTTSDATHQGSHAAAIGADPLTPPDAGWHLAPVRDQVAAEIAARVGADLADRVAATRSSCPAEHAAWEADWLDCWARARAWSGEGISGSALLPQLACR
jgi:hypothetical protein